MNEAAQDILARLERLERLEEKMFFQERLIEELNDALTSQQRQIDNLEARCLRTEEKVSTLWDQFEDEGGELTVPPHYL